MKRNKNSIKRLGAAIILLIGLVGLTMGVGRFIASHRRKSSAPCVVTLMFLDGCKQEWALEHHKATNDIPTWDDLRPYLSREGTNKPPVCPEGGTYILGRVSDVVRCSIGGPYHSNPGEL